MLNKLLQSLAKHDPHKQKELLDWFTNISEDPLFQSLVKSLNEVEDDPKDKHHTRQNVFKRIRRFILSARRSPRYKINNQGKKEYLPVTNDGELIYVRFSGVGSELDDDHYAVVWKAQRHLDQVLVIPTTSFKPKSTIESPIVFNIGKVDFLENETVVLLNQITVISRKRILRTKHVNKATQQELPAKLNQNQIERIKDGLRVLFLGEHTLFEEFLYMHQDRLPLLEDPHEQYSHLHRPFIRIRDNIDELEYALYCDPNVTYRIKRIPTSLRRSDRKKLLYNWINATETDTKSRNKARDDAYNTIKSAMKSPV